MLGTTNEKINLGLSQQEYDTLLAEAGKPQSTVYQALWLKVYKGNFMWLERWLTSQIANGDSRYAKDAVQDAFIAFFQKLGTPPPVDYRGLSNYVKVAARHLWVKWRKKNAGGFDDLDEGLFNNMTEDFNALQNKIEDEILMQEAFNEAAEFLQKTDKISTTDWWILTSRSIWDESGKATAEAVGLTYTASQKRYSDKRTLLIETTQEFYRRKEGVLIEESQNKTKI